MKKSTLPFLLCVFTYVIVHSVQAQNTNYGTGSGTGGIYNSFFGNYTGAANSGFANVAVGAYSGYNGTGSYNISVGYSSLQNNTTGHQNVATGLNSMYQNTTGFQNVANGTFSLFQNTGGFQNAANGPFSLYQNTTGYQNVADGTFSLSKNTTGISNVGVGSFALNDNVTGNYNTGIGAFAGYGSPPDLYSSTAIGSFAQCTASYQVRIGNSSTSSIGGQVSWSTLSDGRFKRDIRQDVSGLEFINQLRPVSYTVDTEAVDKFLGVSDKKKEENVATVARKQPTRQIGFVAQEVEAIVKKTGYVFSGVEAPQNDKDHYSIRYAEFVVPLVKAVQELTAKVEDQEKKISTLLELLAQSGTNRDIGSAAGTTVLFQNNPNPFSAETEIKMVLPETTGQASIIVYNLEGKQLNHLPVQGRGDTSVKISAHELSAGLYIYALIVDGKTVDVKRMILTK